MAPSRRGSRARNRPRRRRRPSERLRLPYTQRNWAILALGTGVIAIGYLCLAQPPVDGFFTLTLAPVLLVRGLLRADPDRIADRGALGEGGDRPETGKGYGRLAQMVRAPALQAGGHWFESSIAHQTFSRQLWRFFALREPLGRLPFRGLVLSVVFFRPLVIAPSTSASDSCRVRAEPTVRASWCSEMLP